MKYRGEKITSAYCSIQDVKNTINYPATDAPVTDSVINDFIIDSMEEIENIYHTKFGYIADSGTASGDYSTTTFSDSTKSWTADDYVGWVVWIYDGINKGQYREITTHTTSKITVSPAFSDIIDATSKYRITKLGYKDETQDGKGTDTQFVKFQPLLNLNALTIDSIDVNTTAVVSYSSGKMVLKTSAQKSVFDNSDLQLINIKYVYGVYPLPRIIKRLCIAMSGIRTLISQVSGTYDDFTVVALPGGFNASKGEPYVNIINSLDRLQREAKGIVYGDKTQQLGSDFRSGPSYRPFTLFG